MRRRLSVAGAVDIAPILIGVVPFAMIAGVAGVENGFTTFETIAYSVIAFAGAAQIASLELFGNGAPLAVVIGTGIVINLRFVMYSAALATYLPDESRARRSLSAYLITDHAYAVAVSRFPDLPSIRDRRAYYLGAACAFWLTWQVCNALGTFLGTGLPPQVPLDFAVPLSFLALLLPTLVDRPSAAAAAVGGIIATAWATAPANLGMLGGAVAGILAGVVVARRGGSGS